MNKFFVIFIFFGCSHLLAYDLVPYFAGNKWGYKNLEGDVVIKAEFDSVSLFQNGYKTALVYSQGYCGLINSLGDILVPVNYTSIQVYETIILASRKSQTTKVTTVFNLNTGKNFTLNCDSTRFSHPNIIYRQNGLWGMYNIEGEKLCDAKYNRIESIGTKNFALFLASNLLDTLHYTAGLMKYERLINLNSLGQELPFSKGKVIINRIRTKDNYLIAKVLCPDQLEQEGLFRIENMEKLTEILVSDYIRDHMGLLEDFGLVLTTDSNFTNIVNLNGDIIIKNPYQIYRTLELNETKFLVFQSPSEYQLHDNIGRNVIPQEYSIMGKNMFIFPDIGIFVQNQKGMLCLLSYKNNEFILEQVYGDVELIGLNYNFKHLIVRSKANRVGVLNLKGETVVPLKYDNIENLAKFGYNLKRNNHHTIYHPTSELYLKFNNKRDTNDFRDFRNPNFLPVYKSGNWGVINSELEIVLPFEYDYPIFIREKGVFIINNGEKFGICDSLGRILVEPKFDEIDYNHSVYYGKIGSKFGLFSSDFTQIDLIYDSLAFQSTWFIYFYKNGLSFLSAKGGVIKELPPHEEITTELKGNLIALKNDDYFSLYSYSKGGLVNSELYQEVTRINGDHVQLKQNDKYGIADADGKIIVPIEYDRIIFQDNLFGVYKNGFLGYYDNEGRRYF
jgi:hypothetical protein